MFCIKCRCHQDYSYASAPGDLCPACGEKMVTSDYALSHPNVYKATSDEAIEKTNLALVISKLVDAIDRLIQVMDKGATP